MAATILCPKWGLNSLKQTWDSMFEEKYYKIHNDDLGIQGIFLLLEGANERVQHLACRFSNTTQLYEKALVQIEEKNKEIISLRKEISKINECQKCSRLEIQLEEATKRATDAENRMNSIAKILCLGTLESNNREKRNNALSIVSQMLLESSPKRKKRCYQSVKSPYKENILQPGTSDIESQGPNGKVDEDNGAVGGIIPETLEHSPLKHITNIEQTKSPSNKKKLYKQSPPNRQSLSVNFPIEYTQKEEVKKKNLSADDFRFHDKNEEELIEDSPIKKKKILSFNIDLRSNIDLKINKKKGSGSVLHENTLDGSLLEYVKDSRSELNKIWFSDDEDDVTSIIECKVSDPALPNEITNETSILSQVIEETPIREDIGRKRADFWLLKEKNELSKTSRSIDGKRLKQTKLELGIKQKTVDISRLDVFNGGVREQKQQQEMTSDKDDDIIPGSPSTTFVSGNHLGRSNIDGCDIASTVTDSIDFQPLTSSTQLTNVNNNLAPKRLLLQSSSAAVATIGNREPKEFVYKRDAVRKKSERAKLEGWDCDDCRKYYSTLSPSQVKARMNACSRHRDKFKPRLNETPPGFWNPVFPDTQECKEKGMYTSIIHKKK